ncbi:hypothetical protein ONZ45_g13773 [Pleurotus djamor]|nr:hypothetical protein ONZ45_g13773 [Pleurotus djamor]
MSQPATPGPFAHVVPERRAHGWDPKWNYTPPPMDGSLTVPEVYDFHYINNPTHPLFKYIDPQSGQIVTLAYDKVVPAAHNAGRIVAKLAGITLGEKGTPPADRPLIALLATPDTITSFTVLLGCIRAEIPFFPISHRNSAPAVAHLLSRTKPTHILVTSEAPIRELVQESLSLFKEQNEGVAPPVVDQVPMFEQLYTNEPHVPLPPRTRDDLLTRFYLHSSGSSSFPKPIPANDRTWFHTAMVAQYSSIDLCGRVVSTHSIAMFHAIGTNFIAWTSGSGPIWAVFAPASPATVPNPESIFQGTVDLSCDFTFGVPSFVELWSKDPVKVEHFKKMEGVLFGGSPLNSDVGNALAQQGVSLHTLYGQTEVGVMCSILGEKPGMDWEYVKFNPIFNGEFVPFGDGTFELVAMQNDIHYLPFKNTRVRGKESFATGDLLVPHPTRHGWWKVLGRTDDQIMLSTGEKTNPGPLEFILCQHPLIDHALFFGRSRFQNGVLIQPAPGHIFDPKDEAKLAEYRNAIWPAVEEMNALAPTHSRVFKEMIITIDPAKPFMFTPKGNPRRPVIIKMYEQEINDVYTAVEDSANNAQTEPPSDWEDFTLLTSFVTSVVNGVLTKHASLEDDFFDLGCDSLQATWIRNAILGALRKKQPPINSVPQNLVYDHSNIASLAQYVYGLVTGSAASSTSVLEATLHDINSALVRYTHKFPVRTAATNGATNGSVLPSKRDVVLVTGTTGSLGSGVLAKLAEDPTVGEIYAVNRASEGSPLLKRQKAALRSRGYDEGIATSPKVHLLEGTVTAFGLDVSDKVVEEEIARSVTHIIHIAWKVDFNLSFHSFESGIGGVRALVDLALSVPQGRPPAKVTFISSVGVFRNLPDSLKEKPIPEVPLPDASIALGQGYSESKWLSEQILFAAAKEYPSFKPVVIRLGQVAGGPNGNWNTGDWVPAIVKSSVALGCLPEYKGICSWIPLDLTARTVAELRDANLPNLVSHLVHPHPVSAKQLFQSIGAQFTPPLPLVPYAEWAKQLEDIGNTSRSDRKKQQELLEKVPALKLLEFFKSGVPIEEAASAEHGEAMGIPLLDTSETQKASPALGGVERQVGEEDARSWILYWREVGFL